MQHHERRHELHDDEEGKEPAPYGELHVSLGFQVLLRDISRMAHLTLSRSITSGAMSSMMMKSGTASASVHR